MHFYIATKEMPYIFCLLIIYLSLMKFRAILDAFIKYVKSGPALSDVSYLYSRFNRELADKYCLY